MVEVMALRRPLETGFYTHNFAKNTKKYKYMYFTHIFATFQLKSRGAKITVHQSSTYTLSKNTLQLCCIDVDGHHREKCEFHCVFLHKSRSIRNPASLNRCLEFRDAVIFLSDAHLKLPF